MEPTRKDRNRTYRSSRVLARVRHRQLEAALEGNYPVSARYARLAERVRLREGDPDPLCDVFASRED